MAKPSYKIPTSLDKSYLDMEIALKTNDGIGKSFSIRVIFIAIIGILLGFFILNNTFMSVASAFIKFAFFVLWLLTAYLMLKRDATGESRYTLIPAMFNYLPKKSRRINTRILSNPFDFYVLAGIKAINSNGRIDYLDDSFGIMFEVIGSASVLLFEDDKNAILNRVERFYTKIKTNAEWSFITVKKPQKVYKQVGNLKKKYDNLDTADPDLKAMANTQFKVLTDIVGEEYRSIHHYLLIKAENLEALKMAQNILQNEVEDSSKMFKRCVVLSRDDVDEVLSAIYQGGDW